MFMVRSMSAAPSPFPNVPERIAEVIYVLCQTLTMRLRSATVTQAQLTYIVGRLLGMRKRFRSLVARIRAGKPPREFARRPRKDMLAPEAEFPLGFRPPPPGWRRWAMPADKPVPLWRSLRQNFAWLLPLAPNVPGFRESAAFHRGELLVLLAEPEAQALLLTSRRVGDSLRPLCWMLGIEVSVLYPARPVGDAAVVLTHDPSPPKSAGSEASPVTGESEGSVVVTPGRIVAPRTGSPPTPPRARDGDDFFAMA
jgi:hypothetical protein